MAEVRIEAYSRKVPRAIHQGWDIRGYIKRHGDWIGPDSETVYRYRTLPNAVKEVHRLAGMEAAYHPFIARRGKNEVAGLATVYTGAGIQHPELPHPTIGADIDYTLTENASDGQHLAMVRALLQRTGSLALNDALRNLQEVPADPGGTMNWETIRKLSAKATAFAVVPVQYQENRLRGFELACEVGVMERLEGPASLTVPDNYAHPYIDFAEGGQQVQLYFASELPSPQYQ
jgi:hypothetical protein